MFKYSFFGRKIITKIKHFRISTLFIITQSLALDQIPKEINEFRLGQILIGWNNNLGKTIYKNIFPLKPAHTLKITANSFEENRYWTLEATPPVRFKTDNEYVATFKELYTQAVKCRLTESEEIGSTLSGGLDSGSITALATMELKRQGKRLQTFSSVPFFDVSNFPNKNKIGDETELINATANHIGNIELNFIRSENLSPVQSLIKFTTLFDEPNTNVMNLYWILSLIRSVQNKKIDTLLIGQSGNSTVSWNGKFQGFIDWETFIKSIDENGITNLLSTVKTHLVKPFIPSTIIKKRRRKGRPQLNWNKCSPINSSFAEKQDFIERLQEAGQYDHSSNPRINQLRLIKPKYGPSSPLWAEMGRLHNVWITDPTADKRILEFCASIPNDQFYRKGVDKYLYKRAMKGIVPDKVLYNERRGKQAADLQQRIMQKDLPEIRNLLETFKKSDICNYYLDLKRIESSISLVKKNDYFAWQQTSRVLLRGIALGLFLQRFE